MPALNPKDEPAEPILISTGAPIPAATFWKQYSSNPILIVVSLVFCFVFLMCSGVMVLGMLGANAGGPPPRVGHDAGSRTTLQDIQESRPAQRVQESSRPKNLGVTQEGFDAIREGMAEEEVVAILGTRGEVLIDTGDSNKIMKYEKGILSSNAIQVIYNQGRVESKAKAF